MPSPAKRLYHFNYLGITQLMAGAGVAIVGIVLVPLLTGLFVTT